MDNTLVVCGGTGAHTALAFLRLHTLGYALGFFDRSGRRPDFPTIYLVDQDANDGIEQRPTAWQLTKRLVALHPGRRDWTRTINRAEPPDLVTVTPLPVGSNESWYERPNNNLANRFESSPYRDALTSPRQQSIDYSKGMMGSPAVGSLLFKLKEYDHDPARLNHDRTFGRLLEAKGRIAVAGSGVGGTGASIAPTLAQRLATSLESSGAGEVMAVLLLEWFRFDEGEGDAEIRGRAQRRNRRMHENAHSALAYYGQNLARTVATVPIGLPKANLLSRTFTGDTAQPVRESFVHLVAALAAYRHFLAERPYSPGLYIMGAVERGRLDGATAIPGGTLQGLANQAATLVDLLDAWRRTLVQPHGGRVRPAIYDAVAAVSSDPERVADELEKEVVHYREQLDWLEHAIGVKPAPNRTFTREALSRKRLAEDRKSLPLDVDATPEVVASALFHWTADWVREEATTANGLIREAAPVGGGHWPDLRNADGLGVSATTNGDLSRIDDANRDVVLGSFVDPAAVSVNGWPDSIAAASFFREAVRQREPVAMRQLELLLVGIVSGELELRRIDGGLGDPVGVTLERLVAEERRTESAGLAEYVVVKTSSGGGRTIAFSSPHTLFAPVPAIGGDEADEVWGPLWRELSGASDGEHWTKAKDPASWGDANDNVILHVLSWIDHLKKIHRGQAPPWTRAFEHRRGKEAGVPFGTGTQLQVLWGGADERAPRVDVHLPTTEVEEWSPPPGTPRLDEAVLFARVQGLRELRDSDGALLYQMVEFQAPDRRGRLRGWWSEHLDLLKRRGDIHIWSRDAEGAVVIAMVDSEGLKAATLADSRLLERRTVAIKSTVPFRQEPVPGSVRAADSLLWPDLPIHSDYFDLLETDDGRHLFTALAGGEEGIDLVQWRPMVRHDDLGRLVATWRLRMRGRSEPFVVEVRVEAPRETQGHHWAHWMVWPRFRTRRGDGWRTYYVYQRSSHPRLRADALWLRGGAEQPSLSVSRAPEKDVPSFPVRYRTEGLHPVHDGGPPLAFVQRDPRDGEQGLYLVPLDVVPSSPLAIEVAVDFGTSHSVAAAKLAGEKSAQPVRLAPELSGGTRGLSLHVSEHWGHVSAPAEKAGLLAEGAWLPTYTNGRGAPVGLLPSDLIFREEVKPVQAESIERWTAGHDYRIPPLHIGRSDLSSVLVSDFKWEAGVSVFRGKESVLQAHYLSMLLELVLAELIADRYRAFPAAPINLTFTYPLRYKRDQVQRYAQTIDRVLARVRGGTGLDLQLEDGIGLYDESRAARLAGERFGEVILVADLGGGTLDLFLSAVDKPGVEFPQVTDSARLGGNFLLRQIAENPDGLLPKDGNWNASDARDTEAKLRAWMRTAGAPSLFGIDSSGDRPALPAMGIRGFQRAADADQARHLLDRYFRLIVEYLARNLAAYLAHHWYPRVLPEDRESLQISVQLRGNGWKLRYQHESYTQATGAVQELVRERVLALWAEVAGERYPAPDRDELWAAAAHHAVGDPKIAPILTVAGKAKRHEDAESEGRSHTPVDVRVHTKQGRVDVPWGASIPFDTDGSKHVEVSALSPPVPMSRKSAGEGVVLRELNALRQSRINGALQDEGITDPNTGEYRAPIGPLVWETIFDTRYFWPEA